MFRDWRGRFPDTESTGFPVPVWETRRDLGEHLRDRGRRGLDLDCLERRWGRLPDLTDPPPTGDCLWLARSDCLRDVLGPLWLGVPERDDAAYRL